MPFEERELEAALRKWYRGQIISPLRRKDQGTVFGIQPEVSSQEAIDVFLELEPLLGFEIKGSSIVKSGGYENIEEFIKDLMPKLKQRYDKQFPAVKKTVVKTTGGVIAHASQ